MLVDWTGSCSFLRVGRSVLCSSHALIIIISSMPPGQGIAVVMSFFQVVRSCAWRQAVCSPMFRRRRSASIVRAHVCLGRPRGLLHAGGGPRIAARSALRWSSSTSALAVWPNSLRRRDWMISDAGMQSLRRRTS